MNAKAPRRQEIRVPFSWRLGALAFIFLFSRASAAPTSAPASQAFEIIGHIDAPQITESSGVVASRKYPGVFWTHNDSGNAPEIFAITREGKLINTFRIAARNIDWEDIAIDDSGHLYLADIGDNNCNRAEIQVYRIAEPDPRAKPAGNDAIRVEQTWRLKYPDKPFDAESLFVLGGKGYIIKKFRNGSPATLYRFNLDDIRRQPITLEKVLDLPIRAPVTAADVSRDGNWLAVLTVLGPFVFRIDGDVTRLSKGASWQAVFIDAHLEGVCFPDDDTAGLLATTEGRRVIHFLWKPGNR